MQSTRTFMPALMKNQALHRAVLRPVAAVQSRHISTSTLTVEQNLELLNKQRSLRPNSPWHIYQPQMTSLSSIANRVTGTGLSVGMYALFLGHLILPAAGIPFDSTVLVSIFADLPGWAKVSAKTILAGPAVYHTINGLRHLSWDMGYLLGLKDSYAAGYAVIGSSILGTIGLVAM